MKTFFSLNTAGGCHEDGVEERAQAGARGPSAAESVLRGDRRKPNQQAEGDSVRRRLKPLLLILLFRVW